MSILKKVVKKRNLLKKANKKAAQKKLTHSKITQKSPKKDLILFLQEDIFTTVGPWRIKLYTIPTSVSSVGG